MEDTTETPYRGRLLSARGVAAVGSLAYALVFVALLLVQPGSRSFYEGLSNLLQTAPPLFAGICGVVRARRAQGGDGGTHHAAGWLLIGAGCLAWGLGQSLYTLDNLRGVSVPYPAWADVAFVGSYPLLISGVFLLLGSMHRAGRARLLLDSAIAAGSVGVLSWYFLVQRLWHQSDVSTIGKILSVAYPLGDIACLFGALVLLGSVAADRNLRLSTGLLALGIVLVACTDSVWTLYTLNEAYQTGSWIDPGWPLGWLFIGQAALVPAPAAGRGGKFGDAGAAAVVPGVLRVFMPYIATTTAVLIIAIHDYAQDQALGTMVLVIALGLMLLIVVRQVFTLLENRYLALQLSAFNRDLEKTVAKRTEQLHALHELTKSVNNTREVDQVLSAAVRHTAQAVQVDAVVLWLFPGEAPAKETGAGGAGADLPPIHLQTGLDDQPELLNFLAEQPVADQVRLLALPHPVAAEAGATDGGATPDDDTSGGGFCLQAPLRWRHHVIGAIGAVRREGGFARTEREMLESIGLEVGTAFENARRYGAAVEAADRDSVTGLYNHRAIHQRLDAEMERSRMHHTPLAVIMMDLNNFKFFNDTYGHPAGDQVLKRVARVLQQECDGRDILGRYGGDEFIALLPDADAQEATAVAQALRDRMAREGFSRSGETDRTVPVTLSFGVAAFPEDSANRHELLTIADTNLYAAKHSEEGIKGTTPMERANRELRSESSFGVLDAMITAVDNKDRYTRRHSEDVTEYALWTAEELGLSEETMRVIRIGGLLHDVGKIGVPDEILRKPGRLTPEEYEVMKRHPRLGEMIVGAVPGMEAILDVVRSHHERWDGQGYPEALAGEEIPFLGRLLAVADAVSAMTTDRPYRKSMDWAVAMAEVRANIGTQFDPAMAEAFLRAAARRRPERNVQEEQHDARTVPRPVPRAA